MIVGTYSKLDYTIWHNGREVYTAGNSPHDSQAYVSAKKGVSLRKMRTMCISTAKEMAAEQNVKYGGVTREQDHE